MHFACVYNWLSVRPVHITGGTNMTFFLIARISRRHGLEITVDYMPKINLLTLSSCGDFAG